MLRPTKSSLGRALRSQKRSLFYPFSKPVPDGLAHSYERYAQARSVVCVVCYTPHSYPVTFIRAHIQRLPAKVIVLYGGYFRTAGQGGEIAACSNELYGRPLLSLTYRLTRKMLRRFVAFPGSSLERAVLKGFLVEHNVDAVLAEFGPAGVAAMEACKATNTPLIVYFRGDDAYSHTALERNGYPELFQHAAAIFAVSRDMVRRLLDLGAPRGKLYYNPSGVDTKLFQGADPSDAPPVFISIGRFTDKKAPHLTLLAFSKAVECVPEARLVMIGDGTLLEACKQLARALDVADAVEFLGEKTHEEVWLHSGRVITGVDPYQHISGDRPGRMEGPERFYIRASR